MRTILQAPGAAAIEVEGRDLHPHRAVEKKSNRSTEIADRNVRPVTRINGHRIRFRDLAIMAFPQKTDANLSFFARVDARTARRWLADDTEPPAEVLVLVLGEIMRRYGRRN